MRRTLSLIILMAFTFTSQLTFGHAERDKARFVAPQGVDEGRCDNRARPCKTLLYAAQNANKGDSILVAAGEYAVTSEQELAYLIDGAVPVLGGFSRVDLYQTQNPQQYNTVLTGIPASLRDTLSKQGFVVIRDNKTALPEPRLLGKSLQQRQASEECVNGSAGNFSCNKIALVSHVPLTDFPTSPGRANDIWGHYDLNDGKEYALLGLQNAFAVVDISDPQNPRVVDSISGQGTTWRDIKVYQYYQAQSRTWQAYAYVTADSASEGTWIVDLSQLPHSIELLQQDQRDGSAHNVYISGVDYSLNIASGKGSPTLHIAGSSQSGGAFRSYLLDDPLSPTQSLARSGASGLDYSHDLSSLTVEDDRALSDCVNSVNGQCRVMLDFNENALRLWDHTDASQTRELSARTYPNLSYVHSGWWSEDTRYVIVHDEGDERNFGLNTTLNIFDISDLTAPTLAGTWQGPTGAVDHNGFIRGNRYYMSNYERGLTILDITNPAAPVEAGFFDTFPTSDQATFSGAWGTYPFLPSGLILVSDVNSGLYVLRDDTRNDTPSFTFASDETLVAEGELAQIEVQLSQSANTEVAYETLPGSASDEDFVAQRGRLNWTQGGSTAQTIELTTLFDLEDQEVDETFFVRLFDPRSGATLGHPNLTKVTITGLANGGSLSLVNTTLSVRENQGDVTINVNRVGGSIGDASVDYQLTAQSATADSDFVATSGTLSWVDGETQAKTITLSVLDDQDSESIETLLLTLSSPTNAILGVVEQTTVTILDDESNQAPSVDAGEDKQVNPQQTVFVQPQGQDPEQSSLEFQWQQLSGQSVEFDADTRILSFSAPATEGALEFQVTVSDNFGETGTDRVLITVVASNPPPLPTPPSTSGGGGGSLGWVLMALCLFRIRRFWYTLADSGRKLSPVAAPTR